MAKFIRLDVKSEWRGVGHKSSLSGLADEEEDLFEDGISCYQIDGDEAEAVENLRQYWQDNAMMGLEDYKRMQVTVFEGEGIGVGSDYEDIATCKRTIVEAEAKPFMEKVYEAYDQYEYEEEITEEEYNEILIDAYRGLFS